jgi:hypothetical protein
MGERITEVEEVIVNKAVAKINETLGWPRSVRMYSDGDAIFKMASGFVDESGGGSVHDVDYYTFPAEALSTLILITLGSDAESGEVTTKGTWYKDYVNYPSGHDDGDELHIENDPVSLRLRLKIDDDEKSIFEIDQIKETPVSD